MKVLVGFVDTREGHAAVRAAIGEVKANGGELHLVSHLAAPLDNAAAMSHMGRVDTERERLEGEAERIREREGIPCTAHLLQDSDRTSVAILRAVEEIGADRIVIGTRRRSAIGKALLGSTAQELLLASPVAVLSVKATEDVTKL